MPIAKIRLPNGKIGRFNVSDGTTPEQVMEYVNQNIDKFQEQQPQAMPTQEAQPNQNVNRDMGQSVRELSPKEQINNQVSNFNKAIYQIPVIGGIQRGFDDIAMGGSQLLARGIDALTLGNTDLSKTFDTAQQDSEQAYQDGNSANAKGYLNDVARIGGGILGGGTGSIAGGALKNIAVGAGIGAATSPVLQEIGQEGNQAEFAKQKAIQLGVGGALGGLAKGASLLTSKVADDIIPLAKRAKEFGIKLRVDQIKPTRFRKTVQKISQDVPFSGVDAQEATQRTQWNAALAKTLGNEITDTTPESINKFSQLNSAKYDKVLKNIKINVFQDDVDQLQQQVNYIKDNVSPLQFKKINNVLTSVIDDFNQGLDGVDFKAVSAKKINGLRRDLLDIASKSQGDAKYTISETADFVHDVLNKSLPKNKQKLLQEANKEYRNFKTIEPLLEKSTTGEINPTDLLNRVGASKYIKSSKQNVGNDDLIDLARIGKQFLPKAGGSDTFAKSATAGVAGASLLSPKTLLTVTGAGALNRLGQSINKSPSNVAKQLSGGGVANKALNAISNNADSIATQASRMTGQAMNAMTNKQDVQSEKQSNDDPLKDIRARRQTVKPVSNNIDLINEIRQRRLQNKPQANNQTQYQFKRPEFVNDTTQAESSGNPNAKSKTSTASGLAGFTDGTWNEMQKKYGKQYGLNNKSDPMQQKIATDLLAQDNEKYLKQKLKRNITNKDLHVAHFMGAGGATRMILNIQRGQGDKLAYQTFRKEANANKPIFFDKKNNNRPRTINEVYAVLASREQ